ncbi:MAG: response regulator [Candidatus Korobacteraceae bacterium]|jgi:CheY-like chemotaxis protein
MKVKKTILCVDDHEQSLSIRKLILETRGYRVIACLSGEQALAAFNEGGVDLVLTDLIMPGMSGNDLVERIKQLSPITPVILFSGQVKIYDQNTLADIFLPKGMYSPAELMERIRLLLIRKRGPKRATLMEATALKSASGS